MTLRRGIDGSEPLRAQPIGRTAGAAEDRLARRAGVLAEGSLACPACDAPVGVGRVPLRVGAPLACPFCRYAGAVRDFLSLTAPTRPARVTVRVSAPARERV